MRAMQINAKKKEYVNAPIGPFTMFSHCECDYNIRNELVSATKNAEDTEYQYQYDDIGNRISSFDLGTNRTYAANNLNQYTLISNLCDSVTLRETFIPQYDDDGNQTLIQTATGIWSVTYNGENRPIFWQCVSPDANTQTLISMSYDRMGRRVTKNNQRFVYNGYLCIGKIEDSTSIHYSLSPIHCFVWDPTEPIATRPLVFCQPNEPPQYYTHDGNKNVSDLTDSTQSLTAHYAYTPFGALLSLSGTSAVINPFRFSSEYADDDLGLIYYNYRYYNSLNGRWLSRDPIEEAGSINLYLFCKNMTIQIHDFIGLVFNKALCFALQQEIQKLVDALKHELKKYDPVLDGRGGFPFRHGNVEDVTKPGGHYEEIKNLQKAIKKRLKKWKDVCSGGPPSCPPVKYPIWADQLANQHIPEPVYNDGTENSNQTVPIIDVDSGGLCGAIVGGMVAGAIAAVMAGNAGPQAFIPEEIVTVPASAVVGAIVGVVGFFNN